MNFPFQGIYTASLTPLTTSFEPNIKELINHVLWLLESGSDGVAILGSTGEANSLTIEQRLKIIYKCGKKLPPDRLIFGTGSCALKDATNLTRASLDVGVNSVLILPPFYYKPQSDESVLRYFSELISIVNDSKLRIIFYNFPKLTGYNFNIKILNKLKREFGEIALGIKDSSGDLDNFINIVQNIPDFMVFPGTESFLLETLRLGGAGCISATANLSSQQCQSVYLAWRNDQNDKAELHQKNLSNLRIVLEKHSFVSGLKSIFANKKNSEVWRHMLPPFSLLKSKEVRLIEDKIKELGLNLKDLVGKK